jgi:hypothetical protein
LLHQRDGRLSAREDDLRSRYSDDERFITDEFSSNLRRAFPLPCDGQEAEDRFRVLLEALRQVHNR